MCTESRPHVCMHCVIPPRRLEQAHAHTDPWESFLSWNLGLQAWTELSRPEYFHLLCVYLGRAATARTSISTGEETMMTEPTNNNNGVPRSPKAAHRRSASLQAKTPEPSSPLKRPLRLRIGIVGAEATGKSCLIKRYCEKRFVQRYLPTIGIGEWENIFAYIDFARSKRIFRTVKITSQRIWWEDWAALVLLDSFLLLSNQPPVSHFKSKSDKTQSYYSRFAPTLSH